MKRKQLQSLVLGIFLLISSCSTYSSVEPTPTLWVPPTAPPISTPTSQIQPTAIPTQISLTLSVRAEAPCRAGPGEIYDLIVNLEAGRKVEIVGKAETFWLVKHSVVTECWVADQRVNIEGDVSTLPDIDPPPTPIITPRPPAPPGNITLKVTCRKTDKFIDEVLVTWTDMSSDEDGFRVYRDGNIAAVVPANKTQVVIVGSNTSNLTHYYYVTAYNKTGESKSQADAIFCKKWE